MTTTRSIHALGCDRAGSARKAEIYAADQICSTSGIIGIRENPELTKHVHGGVEEVSDKWTELLQNLSPDAFGSNRQ